MKKLLFSGFLICSLLMPLHVWADTVQEGQSTEGTDFWVTFMQGDADDKGSTDSKALKRFKLSLSISAREDATVHIKNTYFGFDSVVTVGANQLKEVAIFDGIKTDTRIRGEATSDYTANAKAVGTAQYCYSFHPEMIDSCVLHVTSDKAISLYASNYKAATFDATNVLPTAALQDQYKVQCYTPSDHGGDGSSQGSHFAIVAVEDNTVAEYVLTVNTYNNKHKAGDTVRTDVLKAGQVWYVWTGKGVSNGFGHNADLSGTTIKAYDADTKGAKKIAVFQGNPHTNIPFYKDLPTPPSKAIGERDHIFSQAMPLTTWGNTFVLTTSQLRDRDVIRVMAQEDGTEVYLNGDKTNPIHVFDFSKDTKHYWEFEIGVDGVPNGRIATNGNFFAGTSFLLETSCPAAIHEFMVSKKYGKTNTSNGDPAMLWINPIEQRIDQITFATYSSENGTTHHFCNLVTTSDNVPSLKLDGNPIADTEFKEVPGSNGLYKYAQLDLQTVAGSHRLEGDKDKGFIAHVYGCTGNESYGYNAGGSAKPLTQYITINGEIFYPGNENVICDDDDIIDFTCVPDYDYDKAEWHFGDGKDTTLTKAEADLSPVVQHQYATNGTYRGYVLIYRKSSNLCVGVNAIDSIPFTVPIGNFKVDVERTELPYCAKEGDEVDYKIYLNNPDLVSLKGDSVKISFNDAAKQDGFDEKAITIIGDTVLVLHLPKGTKNQKTYALHLHIGAKCPKSVVDKDLEFSVEFDITLLAQRYNNVLGLLRDSFPTQELSNFVWLHNGDTVQGEETSILYLDETNPNNKGEYYVCFDVAESGKKTYRKCTCPVKFDTNSKQHEFNADSITITASYALNASDKVFVNADYEGEKDIECYAQWITASGSVYNSEKFNLPDGGCTIDAPKDKGLYLLRVVTDKKSRSFKFIIK